MKTCGGLDLGFIALFHHSYNVVFESGALPKVAGCLEPPYESATFYLYIDIDILFIFIKNNHFCFKSSNG